MGRGRGDPEEEGKKVGFNAVGRRGGGGKKVGFNAVKRRAKT